MPVYEFRCPKCEKTWDVVLPVSDRNDVQLCPDCHAEGTRLISSVGFVLKGEDWPSKGYRVKGQMKQKNVRLASKEREMKGDGMVPRLAPNVEGERVDSWSEAKRLAGSKGKDTSSYDSYIREENKTSKMGPE